MEARVMSQAWDPPVEPGSPQPESSTAPFGTKPTTRRQALKKALLVMGGLFGVGAAGRAMSSGGGSRPQALELYGRGWHIQSRDLAKGELPAAGDRMLVYGELLDRSDGDKVGDFFATYFGLYSPGRVDPLASLEQHTFNLSDGAIMGAGSTGPGLESQDEFAIVGGTGRYAGVRGTYIAVQSHQELGGDGSASFSFTLITEATSDDY